MEGNKNEETQGKDEVTASASTWEPLITEDPEFSPDSPDDLKQSEESIPQDDGPDTQVKTPAEDDQIAEEQTADVETIVSESGFSSDQPDSTVSDTSSDSEESKELKNEIGTEQEESTPVKSESTAGPDFTAQPDKPSPDPIRIIDGKLERISDTEQRIFTEVREMHKLYHTEFAGRLLSMQNELDQYRKVEKGRVFDDILAAIARIYGNNETLADETTEPKVKKSIRYLLMDLEELMESYGMSKLRSNQGDKRNPRHCQIHDRIPTEDPQLHDTVVKSYNSGFFIGNRTVIKEMVDIFVYEGIKTSNNPENTQITEAIDDNMDKE